MSRLDDPDRQWAPSVMEHLARVVFQETSIKIGVDRTSMWRSRLSPLLRDLKLENTQQLVDRLSLGDRDLRRKVVDAMTTNETLFFRDGASFEDTLSYLVEEILQQRDCKGPLTIWSAASSSGQEIYSVAMLLDRNFPQLIESGGVSLFATDVSHAMVERVREGRFSALEVRRGLPSDYRDTYFTNDDGSWEIAARLRGLVQTQVVNLLRPWTGIPRCDLILMRNVLIYFGEQERESILARMRSDVLTPHGALIIGASEILNSKHFVYDKINAGVCYRPAN